MLAVVKTPHTKIKIEIDDQESFIDKLKATFDNVTVEREEQRETISYKDSVVYQEVKSNRVGRRLRALRRREGLSQKELSQITGIGQSHLSEIENGKRKVSTTEMAKKLAKGFNVNYKLLLE